MTRDAVCLLCCLRDELARPIRLLEGHVQTRNANQKRVCGRGGKSNAISIPPSLNSGTKGIQPSLYSVITADRPRAQRLEYGTETTRPLTLIANAHARPSPISPYKSALFVFFLWCREGKTHALAVMTPPF